MTPDPAHVPRRLVVDTNVLFSALYDPWSVPGRIILLALEDRLALFAPWSVRDEFTRILRVKLAYSEDDLARTLRALPVEWLESELYANRMVEARDAIADADDAPLIAAALFLGADVVSGDKAFHPLRKPVVRTWKPRDVADGT